MRDMVGREWIDRGPQVAPQSSRGPVHGSIVVSPSGSTATRYASLSLARPSACPRCGEKKDPEAKLCFACRSAARRVEAAQREDERVKVAVRVRPA